MPGAGTWGPGAGTWGLELGAGSAELVACATDMVVEADTFPAQQARTRRFSLGSPRSFTVSPDSRRVVFLRSPAGDDPATSLWAYDVATGGEREVASAATLLGPGHEDLSAEELARRERSRELAGGIVGYACDQSVEHAAFALGGTLWWAPLIEGRGSPSALPAPGGVVDPRPDPTGSFVAFVSGPRLCVVRTGGGGQGEEGFVVLAEPRAGAEPEVTWGSAEFVAAEEMGRSRGFWWAPDGRYLLAARVDNSPVETWWTADPGAPGQPPVPHRYPVAGSADALVSLWLLPVAPGNGRLGDCSWPPERRAQQVAWDSERFPYLAAVHWSGYGPPLVVVEQRDHKACAVLALDLRSGGPWPTETGEGQGDGDPIGTRALAEVHDAAWVDWPSGTPCWLEDGRLLWGAADAGTWRLSVAGNFVTPPGLQVREVTSAARSVVFTASSEPEVVEAWEWSEGSGAVQLTALGGVTTAVGEGQTRVVVARALGWHGPRAEVWQQGGTAGVIASKAEVPVLMPVVRILRVGERDLSVGVLLPRGHDGGKLPVVMSPYGGPGHQMVLAASGLWLEAQWLADQGFAVVVADGRGTPGRGPAFEREVYRDLAHPVLDDQVDALQAAAEVVPELDLGRVGIRGWSFGGYLAALAVLERPDVFHAAVAGAPVTDWKLYDTYYTERFLGRPQDEPEAYGKTSLIERAPRLRRPLLLVHGLADDNVYAAHTLELSGALLLAGRPHCVLPLPGVTHVAAKGGISQSLLVSATAFLAEALARPAPL